MSEQPKTVGGLEPVICENADGTCWISGGNFRELCSDGTWVGLDKSGSVWPTREVAQRFIDRHADQPPSGKDLPTGPGYWTRDGDIVEISRNIFGVGELGYLRRCANTAAGPVESLPRGNWFPAGQQEAATGWTEAERPASGQDHKKPCLCNSTCLGKEQLRSNRVCQLDLLLPAVPQVKDLSEQPKPTTADQPQSGKDWPDGPGVWKRTEGDWEIIVQESRAYRIPNPRLNFAGFADGRFKWGWFRDDDSTLPRGNWFPAVPQEAIAPSGEVERLRAEIRKWIDSGCTPPPSPQELAWYACTSCNARCVKLWREPHGGKVLKCAACLSPDKPVDERGQQPTEHGQTTDQVNYWLPAVPIGDTFYGYSSVPPQCVGWWKGLPTYDAIAQERHQAEVYRQQMVEAERQRDELAEMLKVKNRAANIAELTKRAETAEAELARHPVSIAEANELQDILRTLTNSGTALKTSARELVSAWIRQAHEIDDLRGKLNDTNERLAKVREAYQIYQDTEDTDLYGEVQFLIAFVTRVAEALAEGEG